VKSEKYGEMSKELGVGSAYIKFPGCSHPSPFSGEGLGVRLLKSEKK
jgi:hypothetical protein